MVFCFCSTQYQPMINKIMAETDQVCVGQEVGADLHVKKYIRESITQFEQIDILLIDMTAVRDTDEEIMQSIEALRIMDYKTRCIILAPYKQEGDKFLKDCFFAGIYDMVTTDEYLQMAEDLRLCFSEGMRYKDALRYRDMAEEPVQETMAVQKILIGISGAGKRMGSTHNSIVLANFLRENNQMVAVMEMNASNTFKTFCEAQKAKLFDDGYFSLKGVDFYPECDRERVTAIAGKLYNFILLDFGNYQEADKVLFNKCDVRIYFVGTKPWELGGLEEIFREQDEDVLKKCHFCFLGTTSRKLQKEIFSHMEPLENVWFPEYTEDPFETTMFPEGQQIFADYLRNVKTAERKKGFLDRMIKKGDKK